MKPPAFLNSHWKRRITLALLCLPLLSYAGVMLMSLGLPYCHMLYCRQLGSLMPQRSLGWLVASLGLTSLGVIWWLQWWYEQFRIKRAIKQGYNGLLRMSWQTFEHTVNTIFRDKGYTVEHTGGGGADGGLDARVHKKGQTYIVQVKHWKTKKVGAPTVRELYGIACAEKADGGFIICTGGFTREARAWAKGKVLLIDGSQLIRWSHSRVDFLHLTVQKAKRD